MWWVAVGVVVVSKYNSLCFVRFSQCKHGLPVAWDFRFCNEELFSGIVSSSYVGPFD